MQVSAVFEPCLDNCPDPLTGLVMQPGSPETLIFVDQAEKYDLSWYRSNYVYEESAGGGVPVYVIDTGVKIDHPVPWPSEVLSRHQGIIG